jgi:transcriptional regulator with XRE-family HTH domain
MYEIFEQLLQSNNVTPYKLSKDIGVSQTTFSNWKNGRSVPKQDKLRKIADYFGVTIDYLMGRDVKTVSNHDLNNEASRFEAMISEYPVDAVKMISNLCKSERINKDLTEKSVANSLGIPLEDYLSFENGSKNIGADTIVSILAFFNINLSYITGFLTGALISIKTNESDLDNLLNRLLLTEDMKKEMTEMIKLKSDSTSEDKTNGYLVSADDDLQAFRSKLKKFIELLDSN